MIVPSVVIGAFIFAAVFAPLIAPYDPYEIHAGHPLEGPSSSFLLGTDFLGRDVFSMLLYGARISLSVAILAEILALIIALPVGLVAGFRRGTFDAILMRAVDGVLGIPSFLTALAIVGLFGVSYRNLVIAIGITLAPYLARVVRNAVVVERERTYVLAARAIGIRDSRIALTTILPNIASPLMVQISFGLAVAILQESALSFLGLGIQPPRETWGSLLSSGYSYIHQNAWLSIYPGLCIFLVVWAFNVMGDSLRDALDPRLRSATNIGR